MIDDTDRMIIHALSADIRMSFAKIGAVLGIAEQTVARRYQALVRGGALQCTALIDSLALGISQGVLRITPQPGAGGTLATALARHPDMSWVNITSSEVLAVHRPRSAGDRDEMVGDRIPKTSLVQSISSHTVVRRYPLAGNLPNFAELFTPTQLEHLRSVAEERFSVITERERDERSWRSTLQMEPDDHKILAMLEADARMPYATLAAKLGWTPARAAQRIRELVDSGVMYLDFDVSLPQLGVALAAVVWGKVPVRQLESAGMAVGTLPEVPFVCATTGATNLMASVLCRDTRHLYDVMTEGFGATAGIDSLEVTPVVRQVKQARMFVTAGRMSRVAVS